MVMTTASDLLEKHGDTPGPDFYKDIEAANPHTWSEPNMEDYVVFEFQDGSRLLEISCVHESYLQDIT